MLITTVLIIKERGRNESLLLIGVFTNGTIMISTVFTLRCEILSANPALSKSLFQGTQKLEKKCEV